MVYLWWISWCTNIHVWCIYGGFPGLQTSMYGVFMVDFLVYKHPCMVYLWWISWSTNIHVWCIYGGFPGVQTSMYGVFMVDFLVYKHPCMVYLWWISWCTNIHVWCIYGGFPGLQTTHQTPTCRAGCRVQGGCKLQIIPDRIEECN